MLDDGGDDSEDDDAQSCRRSSSGVVDLRFTVRIYTRAAVAA